MTATIAAALAPEDVARLACAMTLIARNDTESVLAEVLPSLDETERRAMAGHVSFDHAAVLVFPETLDGLAAELARHGLRPGPVTPSVVVRDRLSRRYGIRAGELTLGILHAPVADRTGRLRDLEIFALATGPDLAHIAADERRHGRENHVALSVDHPDSIVLNGLCAAIAPWLRPDGCGYNSHEDSTVLYFRNSDHPVPTFRRLELVCAGRHSQVHAHRRESEPGTTLLRLMTGAWTTQAIATAAELRLPDHLTMIDDLPGLTAATGADQESLARLLRYLTTLGIVRTSASGRYSLTDLGHLLRSDVDGSMRPLALMYGGPFYHSFAALTNAVRTGDEAYTKVFGAHHFTHLAADPELAELFHQSMSASNAMFTEFARVVDLSGAQVVVDVAGGNGDLLYRVLTANPGVRGVLMERPHALTAAKATLAPVADRVDLVPGDFTEAVPAGGDSYLLSRVLHDWDDARCHTILAACAAAMPRHAELLIIERLLPGTTRTDSLAAPWDIHMLCNTGGRERTESHYRALLAAAGFELTAIEPLSLDAHVLRARRATS